MSEPGVRVRWFCQAQMSASKWGPWGRGAGRRQGVWRPEPLGESGGTCLSGKRADGLRWGALS
jgi:hypothetical protein